MKITVDFSVTCIEHVSTSERGKDQRKMCCLSLLSVRRFFAFQMHFEILEGRVVVFFFFNIWSLEMFTEL